ncbi:4567_t:CDS:1 [Dentiscutata erythropus]|uniref:4567_t:CDS:1 n=1 Tax=Dentiscutata erythropus TaxID=1348616 RepID=A0A9N9A1L6_9GLOM|nr:4567_t:CDS:1 [Dentiscutata erythropus]
MSLIFSNLQISINSFSLSYHSSTQSIEVGIILEQINHNFQNFIVWSPKGGLEISDFFLRELNNSFGSVKNFSKNNQRVFSNLKIIIFSVRTIPTITNIL